MTPLPKSVTAPAMRSARLNSSRPGTTMELSRLRRGKAFGVRRVAHGTSIAMRMRCASLSSGSQNESTNCWGSVVPLTLILST